MKALIILQKYTNKLQIVVFTGRYIVVAVVSGCNPKLSV